MLNLSKSILLLFLSSLVGAFFTHLSQCHLLLMLQQLNKTQGLHGSIVTSVH